MGADVPSGRASIPDRKREPYLGAIAIDAHSGKVLVEDRPDEKGYPASVLKIMDLMIVLDKVKDGTLQLSETVKVPAEAAKTGGSQVWLDPRETFTVEELVYALMVQSANDAAVALAVHVGGSKEGFIELMNAKAKALGMSATRFNSVHGLPPAAGQEADITTARDLATLARALVLQHPEALRYTSTQKRNFREGAKAVEMINHNKLLFSYEGCDGFKTGYIKAGGYATVTTATRGGRRVIVAIMGSPGLYGRDRDKHAAAMMTKAFGALGGG
jgi:D-alanyl-D-alanine carboxypeptidase (penicillin-binding protein 5/6)